MRPIKNSRGSPFAALGHAAEGPVSTPFAKARFFETLWLHVARSIARATGGNKLRTTTGTAGRRAMPHRRFRPHGGGRDPNSIRNCCGTMWATPFGEMKCLQGERAVSNLQITSHGAKLGIRQCRHHFCIGVLNTDRAFCQSLCRPWACDVLRPNKALVRGPQGGQKMLKREPFKRHNESGRTCARNNQASPEVVQLLRDFHRFFLGFCCGATMTRVITPLPT